MQTALTFQPLRPWLTHPRETIAGAMLAAVGLVVLAGSSGATPLLPEFAKQVAVEQSGPLAKPLPNQIRDLAPETALELNAHVPIASGPNPAASPFLFGKSSAETRARALECLTSAIYYEAAQEPTDGQRGVAQGGCLRGDRTPGRLGGLGEGEGGEGECKQQILFHAAPLRG